MNILFIDATRRGYVVAAKRGNNECFYEDDCSGQTSSTLFLNIERVCQEAGFAPSKVQEIAVVTGPGSFTGSRIGIAAAKGLAFGGNVKLKKITSLELMLYDFLAGGGKAERIMCIVPCVGGYSYAAIYGQGAGMVLSPRAIKQQELEQLIEQYSPHVLNRAAGFDFKLLKYFRQCDIEDLEPIYLRKSQAEESAIKNVVIAESKKDDRIVQNCLRLEQACFKYPWTSRIIEDFVANPFSHFFEARHNDNVIGYAAMSWNGAEAELFTMAVLPEYRREGVGTRLLNAVLDKARALNAPCVYLEVRVSNRGAQKMYENQGFGVIARREDYYEDGEDALIMKRTLY